MSCERYHDALTEFAAGGAFSAGLEGHLASCGACRGELAALRRALAIADAELARLSSEEPSPSLAARIRQGLAEGDATPAWRFGWLWPVAAASTAALVALAVWVGRPPSQEGRVAARGDAPATRRAGESGEKPKATAEAPLPGGTAVEPGGMAAATRDHVAPPRGANASERRGVGREGGSLVARRTTEAPRDGRPEVLVPRGEAEALVRFAAIVHRGRHAPGAFLAAGQPSPDLAEPAALAIEPLEIVPLDPAENPGT